MTDRIAIRTQAGALEIDDIRSVDDLIEALRTFKAHLGLSNEWADLTGDLTKGQTDKVLGPTRAKGLSPFLFHMYHALFAVKLKMVVDMDQVKRMEARWEGRDASNVRVEAGRVSKRLIERTKPHVLKACGRAGGLKSISLLSAEQAHRIRRKGGKARAKKLTKAQRSEIARMGSTARWSRQKQVVIT